MVKGDILREPVGTPSKGFPVSCYCQDETKSQFAIKTQTKTKQVVNLCINRMKRKIISI